MAMLVADNIDGRITLERTVTMQEDKRLKQFLVLQSFCPLFVLIFIRHVGHFDLIVRFFKEIMKGEWSVLGRAWGSTSLGDVVITILCSLWFMITVIVAIGFKNVQNSGYDHHGEMINIKSEKRDSGVSFFVSFVLPLLVDDVSSVRGFIFFLALLGMVLFLLMRSDLFYQNPVLVALHYKTFEFEFVSPYQDVQKNKTYIGLSKGELPVDDIAIKRKYIADDVFFICND